MHPFLEWISNNKAPIAIIIGVFLIAMFLPINARPAYNPSEILHRQIVTKCPEIKQIDSDNPVLVAKDFFSTEDEPIEKVLVNLSTVERPLWFLRFNFTASQQFYPWIYIDSKTNKILMYYNYSHFWHTYELEEMHCFARRILFNGFSDEELWGIYPDAVGEGYGGNWFEVRFKRLINSKYLETPIGSGFDEYAYFEWDRGGGIRSLSNKFCNYKLNNINWNIRISKEKALEIGEHPKRKEYKGTNNAILYIRHCSTEPSENRLAWMVSGSVGGCPASTAYSYLIDAYNGTVLINSSSQLACK